MMSQMRTTLTLDDDLARLLKTRARERDLPFKQVVNDALRAGLTTPDAPRKPYRMTTSDMGQLKPGVEITGRFLDEIDTEEFIRKMHQQGG
jgi:hypothetical protein